MLLMTSILELIDCTDYKRKIDLKINGQRTSCTINAAIVTILDMHGIDIQSEIDRNGEHYEPFIRGSRNKTAAIEAALIVKIYHLK